MVEFGDGLSGEGVIRCDFVALPELFWDSKCKNASSVTGRKIVARIKSQENEYSNYHFMKARKVERRESEGIRSIGKRVEGF